MPRRKRGRPKLEATVVRLGFVSFFNDFASEMIYPLLPSFLAVTLGAGAEVLGVVEGIAEATAAIGKGVFGWVSDRLRKRKPFVLAGYGASVLARPLIAIAQAWPAVAAIRFADRVGKGLRTAPRDAMIAAESPSDRRGFAFGFQRAMDNAGAVVGPLAAALLLKIAFTDVRPVFALSLLPGAAAVLVLSRIRERPPSAAPSPPGLPPQPAERIPRRLVLLIGIFTLFALANSTDAFLLLRARQTGVPLWAIPLLWAAFSAAKALGNVPAGALTDRIGRIPVILAGWGIYAASYAGLGRAQSPAAVWMLFLLYAAYYALTEGAERAIVADLSPETIRGRAFGAFHMSVGLAALPASVLFGWIWDRFGPTAAFDTGAVLALVSSAGLMAFASLRRR